MLASIPYTQFQEWQAYHLLEPWGTNQEDWRAAMLATVTAKSAGAESKLEDFLPDYDSIVDRMIESSQAVDPEAEAKALFEKMMAWHVVLGGVTA